MWLQTIITTSQNYHDAFDKCTMDQKDSLNKLLELRMKMVRCKEIDYNKAFKSYKRYILNEYAMLFPDDLYHR